MSRYGTIVDAFAGGIAEAGEERAIAGEQTWWQPSASAGVPVTRRTALALAAYFAGVNVLSTDVACLPVAVYQKQASGSRVELRSDPRDQLLRVSPDGETTSMRFRQALMGHALMFEGGYAEIVRNGRGVPTRLHLLDPTTTNAKRAQDGRLFYAIDGGQRTLAASSVLHIAGLGFDGINGYDLLSYGREVFGLGLALQQFASSFVGKGARPSGVLETAKRLSPEQVKFLRAGFEDLQSGSINAGRIALLEPGVTFRPMSATNEEAQHLETRVFVIKEVARLLRIPPHKLMEFGEAHLANIEAANLDYLQTSLMPWLEAIEQECNLKLFTPAERQAGYYVEHSMQALLRGDMRARAEFYTKLRDLGVLSPNDIAARENLDPIGPEGDIRLVPLNMVPLEQAGQLPDQHAPGVDDKAKAGKPAPAPEADAEEELADQVDAEEPASGTCPDCGAEMAAGDCCPECGCCEDCCECEEVEPTLDPAAPPMDKAKRADEPGEWMDGNQLFSVKRIVNDAALGELPVDTSRAMLAASFPGIPPEQLEAIFGPLDGFTPASLQPKDATP